MAFKAGFAEIDITPPEGTKKGGWMEDLEAHTFLDPLFARTAIFESEENKIAFIQLDLLSIRWSDTDDLRKQISEKYDFPGNNIMVSATHNHAGPAISNLDPVKKETAYVESLKQKCLDAFGNALSNMEDAEIGYGSVKEFSVGFNRRTVMRDGTVFCQAFFNNPDALYTEGPIDPEVAVAVIRRKSGETIGTLINFACHPTQHGGTDEITAGYPGVLAAKMKTKGYPISLFLNGAYGNITTSNYYLCVNLSMEEAGEILFEDVSKVCENMIFSDNCHIDAAIATVQLPFRNITEDEYHGRVRGAQRFRSDELYEGAIDVVIEKIKKYGTQSAEVQVLKLGEWHFAGIPAEYFVEHQLRIKTETHPKRSYVVGGANGMVGYVPTKAAFSRGGYETTLGPPSRIGPEAGDILADTAIKLINNMKGN